MVYIFYLVAKKKKFNATPKIKLNNELKKRKKQIQIKKKLESIISYKKKEL